MRKIILGFSRPKNFKLFSYLIMKKDKINFSHSYTRFYSESWDQSFIYQNAGIGTHFIGSPRFFKFNILVEEYEKEITKEVEIKIGSFCVQREGLPYGFKQILGKGIVWTVKILFKKEIKNPFKVEDQTDCIEEQYKILKEAGLTDMDLDINSISVKPYRDWVSSIPGIKRIK